MPMEGVSHTGDCVVWLMKSMKAQLTICSAKDQRERRTVSINEVMITAYQK